MMRCENCCGVVPADSTACPSCGSFHSGEKLEKSLLLGRLAEEFTRELREGRQPGIEECARKHPELGRQIRKLFPTLAAHENAARDRDLRGGAALLKDPPPPDPPTLPVRPSESAYVAGTIFAERYRIVSMLGKGGMGEVYRAEDLKLGRTVALKFLPERLAFDGAALARFHREVLLARQIAHPNVCRVFDIGEEKGRHFLSMEYIDGEDLASLLRRIGRLAGESAMDVARQLCSGLAAAHESGVLHRDLKPANVMMDGRGKVKIADFGLAALAHQAGDQLIAGTPAYMAPEEITRGEFTAESDIYALGLVLYEIFTGRKVFHADSIAELLRQHRQATPERPSRLVKEVDPKVEHWIMRCLEKKPRSRPSAAELAVVFSGGDAVAAALAAGETPSPEMVAASPRERALTPAAGTACLFAFLVSLLLMVLLSGKGLLHRAVPLDLSPDVVADRARILLKSLGYSKPPVDSARGFGLSDDYLKYIAANDRSPGRWDKLRTGRPPVLYFWYRQSPSYLVPASRDRVTADDPPFVVPAMATVFLDTNGNLAEFRAVAAGAGASGDIRASTGWKTLFNAAGLNLDSFRPVDSDWISPLNSDERATWEGHFADNPETIRVGMKASRLSRATAMGSSYGNGATAERPE